MRTTLIAGALAFAALLTPALAAAAEARSRASEKEAVGVIVSPGALATAPAPKLSYTARTFVPLHSTLLGQGGVTRLNFSGALYIHNASATNVLSIDRVEYRAGSGELVETYVTEPILLRPYGSMQVIVAQADVRGGAGASFTVDWSTPQQGDEPVIDALMTSFVGTHSYSFLVHGHRVARPQ